MTFPLIILAVFSIAVAWGTPIWNAHASYLEHALKRDAPLIRDMRVIIPLIEREDHRDADTAEWLGLGCAILGIIIALGQHLRNVLAVVSDVYLAQILRQRLYFDTLYDWLFTKPTVELSRAVGVFDKNGARSVSEGETSDPRSGFGLRPDYTLDGAFTGAGRLVAFAGKRLAPLQTGSLRGYIAVLGLTVVSSLAILWVLSR